MATAILNPQSECLLFLINEPSLRLVMASLIRHRRLEREREADFRYQTELFLSPPALQPMALMKGLLNMCRGEMRRLSGRNQSCGCRGLVRTFAPLTGMIALLGSKELLQLSPGSLEPAA
ncbi:hypothetical protein U1Q18_046121 [Sarracenia purpurea var. burkii]